MGGIYNAYYMWHGGTNFGRSVASKLLTSYDYDAPLDEYGLKSEPKFSHLSKLHHVLKSISSILLENEPRHSKIQPFIDSQIYGPFNDSKESVAFLSNTKGDGEEVVVEFYGATYAVRKWTTLIIKGPANKQKLLFTTSDVVDNRNYPKFISTSSIKKVLSKHEPIGIWNKDSSRYQYTLFLIV